MGYLIVVIVKGGSWIYGFKILDWVKIWGMLIIDIRKLRVNSKVGKKSNVKGFKIKLKVKIVVVEIRKMAGRLEVGG